MSANPFSPEYGPFTNQIEANARDAAASFLAFEASLPANEPTIPSGPSALDPRESDEPTDELAELEALASKMERETQVYLGFRNAERAAMLRRVAAELAALRKRLTPEPPCR